MPTVICDKERLFAALGRSKMTIDEFDQLCFDFGVELDEVTSEKEMLVKERGDGAGNEASERVLLKIDVSANRYDLLCEEGLARALRIFIGAEKSPQFKVVTPSNIERIIVRPSTAHIRPFVVAAILRNVTLTEASYNSFIDLQDKLHSGLCRRRTKVAIGTHDYDKVKGPFSYEALAPEKITFVPLNQAKSMDGHELMTFYEADRRLSKFLPIIRDSPVYPVIYDHDRRVLSLPPIINGDHSKITLATKNILIECTATEEPKARTVINMVVGMFSEYCRDKFSVEQVEVIYETNGKTIRYPDLTPRVMEASANYINSCIGSDIHLSAEDIVAHLSKMGLMGTAKKTEKDSVISVSIPPTRSDVLHPCDIMEDVAVAYGINRIPKTLPGTNTVGAPYPLNKLGDFIRRELAMCGWSEVLPLTLCSHAENYDFLCRQDPGNEAIILSNPKTLEYEVVRTSLIPGMMKTVASNKKAPLPLKLFEVGDVVLQAPKEDRRARNERRVCVFYSNRESGFELIHGVLDRILAMLDVPLGSGSGKSYAIRRSSHGTFFPGRQADIIFNGEAIGSFGIIHPTVLEKFELHFPCSCLEIKLEPFL